MQSLREDGGDMARTTATDTQTASGTQSVERALSLLSAFTDEHPERRISELGSITGLGQSTVSRLVGALETLGFLTHDERSGMYRLGPEVVSLAGVALNQSPVFRQARQVAQNLAHDLDLGANVAELRDGQLFYLCHFEGRQAPRTYTLMGRTGPLHATALGKALLFGHSDDEVEQLIGGRYPAYTPHTIKDVRSLLGALAESRLRGYSTELEELAFGRACLAAPIRDRTGQVVAALSASGPLSVINLPAEQQALSRKVIEHADEISTALGYHASIAIAASS
jgi:DNA-binding IclR family transcriptional regulator